MIADAIGFFLANFTLTYLLIGVLAAAAALLRRPRPWSASLVVEQVFAYFLLWSVARPVGATTARRASIQSIAQRLPSGTRWA